MVLKKFVSVTMVAVEMGKSHYFRYHSNCCKEEKILHQKYESHIFEHPLIKLSWLDISTRREKMLQSQKDTFWEKESRS